MAEENQGAKPDDTVLLARYHERQDAAAFAELVRRHAGMVYGTSLRVLGDSRDAEDVAQECFMELAAKAGTVIRSLPGWLHAVATSRSLDVIRRSARRRKREESAMLTGQMPPGEPTWEAIAPDVDRALAELPEELRLPLILHYLQGKDQAGVARELGVSQSTVSRRLETGVAELRQKLKKAGIVASVALLINLLSANGATAAPPTLLASLGKMAIAGVGRGGGADASAAPAAPAAPALSGIPGPALAAAGVLILASIIALDWIMSHRESRKPAAAPNPPPAASAAARLTDGTKISKVEQPEQEGAEMQKSWMIGVVTMTVAVASAMAETGATIGAKAPAEQAAAQAPAELKEMTVEGVFRMASAGPVVVTDNGIARLPMSPNLDLKSFEGSTVRVAGMGVEEKTNSGKKVVVLKSIKTIEKVAAK